MPVHVDHVAVRAVLHEAPFGLANPPRLRADLTTMLMCVPQHIESPKRVIESPKRVRVDVDDASLVVLVGALVVTLLHLPLLLRRQLGRGDDIVELDCRREPGLLLQLISFSLQHSLGFEFLVQ
jgi:hypothetical protein